MNPSTGDFKTWIDKADWPHKEWLVIGGSIFGYNKYPVWTSSLILSDFRQLNCMKHMGDLGFSMVFMTWSYPNSWMIYSGTSLEHG